MSDTGGLAFSYYRSNFSCRYMQLHNSNFLSEWNQCLMAMGIVLINSYFIDFINNIFLTTNTKFTSHQIEPLHYE